MGAQLHQSVNHGSTVDILYVSHVSIAQRSFDC
jgi:hypothetical protein